MSGPRYASYRASGIHWIGEIPEHWVIVPLKAVSTGKEGAFIDGDWIESRHLADSGVRYITTGNVGPGFYKEQGTGYISNETFAELGCTEVLPGDVLISRLNAPIGRACLVPDLGVRVVTSVDNVIVRPIEDFDRRFLVFRLSSPDYLHEAGNIASGATMQRISRTELGNMRVAFPPLDEQAAIANFLDRETAKIDALIAEQEELIALLAEKRQATISHAVTQGLDPHAPMKDSGVAWVGEVPAHWEAVRVKALSQFTTSGPRGWSDRITEEGSLFIQSGDLNDSLGLDYGTAKRVDVGDDAEAARTRLSEGDVVVCITGAKTGNVALCSSLCEPAYVNQHLCLIRTNEDVHGRFLAFALKSTVGQTQLEVSQYGLKQGLSLESVRETWVARPPRDEQQAIAEFLDEELGKFTSLALAADTGISLLKERRSALIAAAVTGQIDVRAAVSMEEPA